MSEIIADISTELEFKSTNLQTNLFKVKEELYNNETVEKISNIMLENSLIEEDLLIFLSNFDEMIQNSIDAESTNIRSRLKFDKENKDLIFTIGDNGKGIKSKSTNNKKSDYSFGGEGLGIENLKIISNGRFKIIKNKNGAIATVKINIKEYKNHTFKNMLKKQFKEGKITKEEYDNFNKIDNIDLGMNNI